MKTPKLFLLLCSLALLTKAQLPQNVTIDDEYKGDELTYQPTSAWTQGAFCDSCTHDPVDARRAFNGTWHVSSVDFPVRSIIARFTGNAVYAYFLTNFSVINNAPQPQFNITLDGELVDTWFNVDSDTNGWTYDYPLYVNTTMENRFHELRIDALDLRFANLWAFDRLVYTTLDPPFSQTPTPITVTSLVADGALTSTLVYTTYLPGVISGSAFATGTVVPTYAAVGFPVASDSNAAAIVGGVLGPIAALSLIAAVWLWLRRKRQIRGAAGRVDIDGYEKPKAASKFSLPRPWEPLTVPESHHRYTVNSDAASQVSRSTWGGPTLAGTTILGGKPKSSKTRDSNVMGGNRMSVTTATLDSISESDHEHQTRPLTIQSDADLRRQVEFLTAEVARLRGANTPRPSTGSGEEPPPIYREGQRTANASLNEETKS